MLYTWCTTNQSSVGSGVVAREGVSTSHWKDENDLGVKKKRLMKNNHVMTS